MQFYGPLDHFSLWGLLAVTVALIFAAIEGGYRLGRSRRDRLDDEMEGPVGGIVAATLALLGFILAFTFSLAATRFQSRREIIVEEDNAIGTCFLRAGMLPDGRGPKVRSLLRDYVDARLEVLQSKDIDGLLKRSDELHRQLWKEAEAAGREHPESIVVGLFVQSLNETIDMHSTRILVSIQNRLPLPLWVILYAATLLTMMGVGYHEGLSKSRRSPAIVVLVLVFALIFGLIADLDRPQEGWLRVGTGATVDLRKMMDELN